MLGVQAIAHIRRKTSPDYFRLEFDFAGLGYWGPLYCSVSEGLFLFASVELFTWAYSNPKP